MSRHWIGRIAVRAYPAEARAVRGEELVGTLLDAGDHSLAAFGRQVVSLIVGGLAARSREAFRQPLWQLALDVVRWATIMIVARRLIGEFAWLRWESFQWGSFTTVFLYYAGPALILTAFTAGRDRAAGVIGLVWITRDIVRAGEPGASVWIELWLLPIVGFALMTIAPQRKPGPARALWIIPGTIWAIFGYTELGQQSGIGYITPALASLVLVPIQPALVVGTAVAWSLMAAWYLAIPAAETTRLGIELLSCTPLALILATLSARIVRRV